MKTHPFQETVNILKRDMTVMETVYLIPIVMVFVTCLKFMDVEFQKLSLKNDIQSKVRNDLDQQQREYFLNQQLKQIEEFKDRLW